jgi:DNA-binding transcriptional regulator YiaG
MKELIKACFQEILMSQEHAKQTRTKSMEGQDLVTRKEASTYLKVSTTTLHNWEKRGVLYPIRHGRLVYYRLEDLNKSGRSK